MKEKWYRSNITKAILMIAAHVLVVVMVACFVWIATYPAIREELFAGKPAKKYEDSRNFIEKMLIYSHQAVVGVSAKEQFETEGRYDPDKLVDIEQYYDTNEISGKNKNGFAYRLEDLLEWARILDNEETFSETADSSDMEDIVVCRKSDGTYYYYILSDFYEAVDSGELTFAMEDESEKLSVDSILSSILNEEDLTENVFRGIQDTEGEIVYTDCWVYDGARMEETFSPEGAKNVLEIVNSNPNWNGRLDEMYTMLESVIRWLSQSHDFYRDANANIEEGDTNFFYLYVDTDRKKIYTNKEEYSEYEQLEISLEKMRNLGKYIIVNPKLADFESNLENVDATNWRNMVKQSGFGEEDFLFAAVVDTSFPVQDTFYNENQLYSRYGSSAREVVLFGCMAAALIVVCIFWLCAAAGRSDKDEELHLNGFDRWKTEFAAAFVFCAWLLPMMLAIESAGDEINYLFSQASGSTAQSSNISYLEDFIAYIMVISLLALYTLSLFFIGFLSLIRRIKAKTVWSNSFLKMLLTFVGDFFRNLNCFWNKILLYGGFVLIHWIVLSGQEGMLEGILFVIDAVGGIYYIYTVIGQSRIKAGLERISQGEVTYEIPLDKMLREEKGVAQRINSLRQGLEKAVDESVKSERLKTDLITNVSHDIKTPLTSIINYVGLLKQEKFEDLKIQRYIEVLEQKSQRLKTLTEDVVEASKISSGNIVLRYMNVNFAELIAQVSGEFEEKFEARNLKEVLILPEKEVIISVDGRRMWRVLANIYSNAAKYAMEGTRVYAELCTTGQQAVFSLKNISEQALNISADELTERFIRGDISRSTEGSGLGLSIAQTLTHMQNGEFELYLDGDLFKVTITFPLVYPE